MTRFQSARRALAASSVLALALGLFGSIAAAQTPAASATPAVVLPKLDCGAKPEHPGKLASDNQKRQWRKDANTYLECFKKYASDQRTLAQQYQDAANTAIDDYNAAVKEMQAAMDAAAQ